MAALAVSRETGVPLSKLFSRSKKLDCTHARQTLFHRLRGEYQWGLQAIGYVLGYDHSSVICGIEKIELKEKKFVLPPTKEERVGLAWVRGYPWRTIQASMIAGEKVKRVVGGELEEERNAFLTYEERAAKIRDGILWLDLLRTLAGQKLSALTTMVGSGTVSSLFQQGEP